MALVASMKSVWHVQVHQFLNTIFACWYSRQKCAKIDAYASTHGTATAAKQFSKELGHVVKESTVKSIRNAYKEASNKQRNATGNSMVASLPKKKRGRTLLLGDSIDRKLQLYLKTIWANGGAVTAGIAIAAARGLVLAENKNNYLSMVATSSLTDHGLMHCLVGWT